MITKQFIDQLGKIAYASTSDEWGRLHYILLSYVNEKVELGLCRKKGSRIGRKILEILSKGNLYESGIEEYQKIHRQIESINNEISDSYSSLMNLLAKLLRK